MSPLRSSGTVRGGCADKFYNIIPAPPLKQSFLPSVSSLSSWVYLLISSSVIYTGTMY